MVVRRRIRCEGETVFFSCISQRIQDDAGLDARGPLLRIEIDDSIHVLGGIQDDRNIAALPRETRPPAAGENGRAKLSRDRHCLNHVVSVSRNNHANGHLAIVRSVGCIECAAASIKAHFAANSPAQI